MLSPSPTGVSRLTGSSTRSSSSSTRFSRKPLSFASSSVVGSRFSFWADLYGRRLLLLVPILGLLLLLGLLFGLLVRLLDVLRVGQQLQPWFHGGVCGEVGERPLLHERAIGVPERRLEGGVNPLSRDEDHLTEP
jgi:hypothetical protein